MRRITNLSFNGVPIVIDDVQPNPNFITFEAQDDKGQDAGLSGETINPAKDYVHVETAYRRHVNLHKPATIKKVIVSPEIATWLAGMQDQVLEISGVTQ